MPKITKVPSSPKSKSRTAKNGPTREEIQFRAYQIYLERSGALGNEFDDWVQAERELLQNYGKTGPTAKPHPVGPGHSGGPKPSLVGPRRSGGVKAA